MQVPMRMSIFHSVKGSYSTVTAFKILPIKLRPFRSVSLVFEISVNTWFNRCWARGGDIAGT